MRTPVLASRHAPLVLALVASAACSSGGGGSSTTCVARTEICNGLDDDCDGAVDDGDPGGGAACGTGLLGRCAAGTLHCVGGAITCVGPSPIAEACGNGVDDDCDGLVDNHCCPGSSCTGGTLTTCDASNDPVSQACALGCAPGGRPACAILEPSIVASTTCAAVLDAAYPFLDAEVATSQVLAVDTRVAGSGCDAEEAQASGPPVCIVFFRDLTISSGATLRARGDRVLAVVARNLVVDGRIDADGTATTSGPGGPWFGGSGGAGGKATDASGGGGGGGFGTAGAPGGGVPGGAAGTAGSAYGSVSGGPLLPGTAGGSAGGVTRGGGGGGGLALVGCASVTVGPTAVMTAGGGGGSGGSAACVGGGGGGSGGAIVIEAGHLVLHGTLASHGGGGGGAATCAGASGHDGADGSASSAGGSASAGAGAGGTGGTTALPPTSGSPAAGGTAGGAGGGAGGGGGAVGRIRIGTPASAPPDLTGSAISPSPSVGTAAVR